MSTLKAVRGTRDLLPPETELWNHVETVARQVFARYNFGEIRTPIFEDTQLFARGVGEETDIVSKEMYTWSDGDRFDQRKMIAEWVARNAPDNPAHVQAGRVHVERFSPILTKLNEIGVQLQTSRGISVPNQQLPTSIPELVCFRPTISAEAISALLKARELAKSDPASDLRQMHVRLRLVVPNSSSLNPWVDRSDVTIEQLDGSFFASSQSLTLRPENTAGVVRAYIEHKLGETGLLQKLFYIGPQFRRERPQKGRYRQFWQIGAEVIGPPSAGSESSLRDAEVLEMLATLLDELGIHGWRLEINSVGSAADRVRYVAALREALAPIKHLMCEDNQRRAETNPLRVLDSKDPDDQERINGLPKIADYLDEDSKAHFAAVLAALDACGVPYTVNPRLVRGLDYYTRTTFEFTHGGLGAQNALLGGGRYDGLSELIGGPKAPGIGFAMGEDRLVLTLEAQNSQASAADPVQVYVVPIGSEMNPHALTLARMLRKSGVKVELGDGAMRPKKNFELADKLGARYALIVGPDEAQKGEYSLKNLETATQTQHPQSELFDAIKGAFKPLTREL